MDTELHHFFGRHAGRTWAWWYEWLEDVCDPWLEYIRDEDVVLEDHANDAMRAGFHYVLCPPVLS